MERNNMFDVKEKVVIITGGSGLLGAEFSKALTEAGAHVVVFDIAEKKSEGDYARVDITDEADVKNAVAAVLKKYGKIDVLVNNACMNPGQNDPNSKKQWERYEEYPKALWDKEIEVGLTGTLLMTQAVTPFMKKAKQGSIINIASIYGLVAPDNDIYEEGKFKSIAYATIKSAIYNFTRTWASYLGSHGIRVNTLTFGGVKATQTESFVKKYSAKTMLGRMANRDEYNGAVLFLSSDASSYVTGSNIVIDGGWSAW